jgi:diguanylate cyclase (GGDEF)-like protein/PAS domain S-box-containing protein
MLLSPHAPELDRATILIHSRMRQWGIGLFAIWSGLEWLTGSGLSGYGPALGAIWYLSTLAHGRVVRRNLGDDLTHTLAFATLMIDGVLTAVTVSLLGSVWWCSPLFFTFLNSAAVSMLPLRRVVMVGAVSIVSLACALSLQASGVVPSSTFLGAPSMSGEWRAVATTVGMVTVAMVAMAWMQQNLVVMLRERSIRYRAMMDTASDMIAVVSCDGRVKNVNRAALLLAQCSRADMLRDGLQRVLISEDLAVFRNKLSRALAGEQQTVLLRARAYHGIRWLSCTIAPMTPGVRTTDLLAMFRDVTDDRLAADTMRSSEARLRAVFNQAAIAIALLDADGCFVEVNPAVERLLGYDEARLIGRPWNAFAPPEDHDNTANMISALNAQERETVLIEQRFIRTDGRVLWAQLTLTRVENPTGAAGLIAMLQDITERRALEAQLTWQAYHDPLTNLANRALFRERVDAALANRADTGGHIAVLFLDLDNFKTINDSMGHAAGDQLLFEVGRRLLNATRGCDTVARLGGDEFAILIDNVRGHDDGVRVADRVLQSMHAPVLLDGTEVTVGTSIGIVRDSGKESADEILRNADVAMYNAKQAGKGRHSLFEPGMHDKAVERLRLETDLRAAIERDEITLAFQPIVTLANGMPCGFEALARWTHPTFGAVSPGTFIPLAEETGLIVGLGATILRRACRHAAGFNALTGLIEPLGITVNLSGRQLEEQSVVTHVRDALMDSGLDPALLTLEITETALVQNSSTMRQRLHELKAIGVSLAVDDFGTGYSSLSYIQQFPVDVLKIDRSFVEGLKRTNGADVALARTIIALGASLQLRTVAEGIEVDAQRAILRELGCEYGQGYFYARPMPAYDVMPWLAKAFGLVTPTAAVPILDQTAVPPQRLSRNTREFTLISGR